MLINVMRSIPLIFLVFIIYSCSEKENKSGQLKDNMEDKMFEETSVDDPETKGKAEAKLENELLFQCECEDEGIGIYVERTSTGIEAYSKEKSKMRSQFIVTECIQDQILYVADPNLDGQIFSMKDKTGNEIEIEIQSERMLGANIVNARMIYNSDEGLIDIDIPCDRDEDFEYQSPENCIQGEEIFRKNSDNVGYFIAKWKNISVDEYGIMVFFKTKEGDEIVISNFDLGYDILNEDNPYFSSFSDGSAFTRYKLHEEIKDQYYRIEYIIKEVPLEAEPDEIEESKFVRVIRKVQ